MSYSRICCKKRNKTIYRLNTLLCFLLLYSTFNKLIDALFIQFCRFRIKDWNKMFLNIFLCCELLKCFCILKNKRKPEADGLGECGWWVSLSQVSSPKKYLILTIRYKIKTSIFTTLKSNRYYSYFHWYWFKRIAWNKLRTFEVRLSRKNMAYPPYSTHLSDSKYHFFQSCQNHFSGVRFKDREDIKKRWFQFLALSQQFWQTRHLQTWWNEVVENNGGFVIQ